MRIRVPIQMLNDASSRLSNMEVQIAQNSNTLNKIWSGLRLEAKSRAAVESRVNQARTMAGRLSSETSSLSKYLVLVNERFIEADRKEGVSIAKTGKEYLSFVGQNGAKNSDAYFDLNKKFASLALINPLIAASLISVPAGIVGLKWVKNTTYLGAGSLAGIKTAAGLYSGMSFLPGSNIAGVAKEAISLKEDAAKIIDGASESSDLYDFGGKATGVVATRVVAGKIGTAVKFAVGTALVGAGAFASMPIWVPMAIGIGTGIAVGYGVSVLLDVPVGGDSISDHISDTAGNLYRAAGDFVSKVGPNAVQSSATAADSIITKVQSAGDTVGNAINNAGEIVKGLGKKIKL